jgi:hypothetical protein
MNLKWKNLHKQEKNDNLPNYALPILQTGGGFLFILKK